MKNIHSEKLGNVCEVTRGSVITKKTAIHGEVPVVAGGLRPAYFHNQPNRPASIITVSGSGANAGFVNFYDMPIYASDCSTVLPKVPDRLNVYFAYYYLLSVQDYINKGLRRGAAQPHVYPKDLAQLEIPLPPFLEQKRIVAILDKAFAGIDAAVANTEKNLANAREFFQSIINSAITGELTKEWRRLNLNTKNSCERLRQVLSERCSQRKNTRKKSEPKPPFYDKQIDLPSSWVLASPEQLSTDIIDCPHSTPKWSEFGAICLRTTNFKPGFLNLESVRFVSEGTYLQRIARLEPKPGDVLYSREGGILGIACIIPAGLKACLGQRMMQFRLDTKLALPIYFTSVLNSHLVLSEVNRLTGGAAAPHLNIRDIRTFPIPLPPLAEQHVIVNKIEVISAQTKRLETIYQQKLTALAELKQSILQKAFAGELTTMPGKEIEEVSA